MGIKTMNALQVSQRSIDAWNKHVAEALRETLNGAFGAAFLSPIALTGRTYRAAQHLDDARRFCEAVRAEASIKRVLYHSSLSAHPVSPAPCLSAAAAGEELVSTLDAETFLRGGACFEEIALDVTQAGLAMALVWVGNQLGSDFSTAVVVVLGVRIFQNVAAIRRRVLGG